MSLIASIVAVRPLPEEKAILDDEIRVERVRLPPIFKAAAERPRHRTVDESNEILKGQKSLQFEHKSKTQVQLSGPESRLKSPQKQQRHEELKRNISPSKKVNSKDGSFKRTTDYKIKKLYSYEAIGKNNTERSLAEECKGKAEKTKRKRKSRSRSPTKSVISQSNREKIENSEEENAKMFEKIQELIHVEITNKTAKNKEQKASYTIRELPSDQATKEVECLPHNPVGLSLNEGDFVAIKVPQKLYIKGQPCLGKVTTLSDNLGLLTVHYYTGSYDGYWRPMMSRTSPYLRKVPQQNVLCKFKMSDDGRMSPITRNRVRKIVDEEGEK